MIFGQIGRTRIIQGWRWSKGARPGVRTYGECRVPSAKACPFFLILFPSVPVSKLPQLVAETKKDLSEIGIVSTIVGHVGDGNFHAQLLFRTAEEEEVVRQAVHRMVKRAIAMDGTCERSSLCVLVR